MKRRKHKSELDSVIRNTMLMARRLPKKSSPVVATFEEVQILAHRGESEKTIRGRYEEAKRKRLKELLRCTKRERGERSEHHVLPTLESLQAKGIIIEIIAGASNPTLDQLLHVDYAVRRAKDGALVPIQVKSSEQDIDVFIRKYRTFFLEKFHSLPVFVHSYAEGIRHEKEQKRMRNLEWSIISWPGYGFEKFLRAKEEECRQNPNLLYQPSAHKR